MFFKKLFYLFALLGLLFFGTYKLFSLNVGRVEHCVSYLLYPFLCIESYIILPVKNKYLQYKSYNELKQNLDSSIQENQNLKARLIELEALMNYKSEIKELTDFAKKYKLDKVIIAQVLLHNFDSQSHFILIDAGSYKGVTPDMVVIYKNCLIGRVSQVFPCYSKVILITDKTCKVAAYCAKNGVRAIHEGTNIIDATNLTFVNHLQSVHPKDMVISSGEGLIFPRGLALGHIKEIKTEGFNYSITVEPMLDLRQIKFCSIIEKGLEFKK